ncbi:MAG TPA: hypothetical protein VIM42_01705 [Clostridium sp.]
MNIKANSDFEDLDEFLEAILQENGEIEDYNLQEAEVISFDDEQIIINIYCSRSSF